MLWWSPNIKLFSLLLHNCRFATVMNRNAKIWYAGYLIRQPLWRSWPRAWEPLRRQPGKQWPEDSASKSVQGWGNHPDVLAAPSSLGKRLVGSSEFPNCCPLLAMSDCPLWKEVLRNQAALLEFQIPRHCKERPLWSFVKNAKETLGQVFAQYWETERPCQLPVRSRWLVRESSWKPVKL